MLKWTISQQEESAKTDVQTQAEVVQPAGSKAVIRMRRVRVKSTITGNDRTASSQVTPLWQGYTNEHWAAVL